MIGLVRDRAGEVIGLHRTYLQEDADGGVSKAPIAKPRMMLGKVAGGAVRLAAVSVTVPLNASVAFPIGSTIDLEQTGAGQVAVAAEAGVTINKPAGYTAATASQFAVVRLRKVALNTWTLFGELA